MSINWNRAPEWALRAYSPAGEESVFWVGQDIGKREIIVGAYSHPNTVLSEDRPTTGQPVPNAPKETSPVVSHVMKDLVDRLETGIETYGQALRPNNGRDTLQDAYEEALDLAIYLRSLMEERKIES